MDGVEGAELGGDAAVHAQNPRLDEARDGHAVERVGEQLPNLHRVAALTLVVEAIDAVDRRALVVAAQKEKVVWEFDLVGHQQQNRLERLATAVDVVAEENVILLRRKAREVKKTEEIVVLSVDVAADADRREDLDEHRLAHKNRARLQNEELYFIFGH